MILLSLLSRNYKPMHDYHVNIHQIWKIKIHQVQDIDPNHFVVARVLANYC